MPVHMYLHARLYFVKDYFSETTGENRRINMKKLTINERQEKRRYAIWKLLTLILILKINK